MTITERMPGGIMLVPYPADAPVQDQRITRDRAYTEEQLAAEIYADRVKLQEMCYEEAMRTSLMVELTAKRAELDGAKKSFTLTRAIVDGASVGIAGTLAVAGLCVNPMLLPLAALSLVPALLMEREAGRRNEHHGREMAGIETRIQTAETELKCIEAKLKKLEQMLKTHEEAFAVLKPGMADRLARLRG